jgi:aspartate dehydrogenase
MRVGIIGAGTISRAVFDYFKSSGTAEVDYLLVSDRNKPRNIETGATLVIDDIDEALDRKVDLIVEAAMAENVRKMAPKALQHSDFCAFSCTALAGEATEAAVRAACAQSGRSFYVPHGAILGLDGIQDGRDLIESISITTTKSGKSLGLAEDTDGVVFDGTAREVCSVFPRSVNVHAALALAGVGFDRTTSRVVAKPGITENHHRIEVAGQGFSWAIEVSSRSLGGVTGAYTPLSAIGSIKRILSQGGISLV